MKYAMVLWMQPGMIASGIIEAVKNGMDAKIMHVRVVQTELPPMANPSLSG